VAVVMGRTLPHPTDPSKTYTTSWFDMWRFVDGKADEHWDAAELFVPPPAPKK
jgi:predicted SnoaL-like aldol condensation-catalyzing enzyme